MATSKKSTTSKVKVADTKKAMAALNKIRKRDAELLKRLAR